MSRPGQGRGAAQRRVYGNTVPGGTAEQLIVLSEQDWNDRVDDCVVVPCWRLPGRAPSPLLVHLGDDLYADCTRVQSIPQDELGDELAGVPDEQWARVRLGVRLFLCIDQLKGERSPLQPEHPSTGWWPRQGDVRYRHVPAAPATKMHAAITDDAWNGQHPYTCAAQLTSTSRAWRRRWEGLVPGGNVIAGDLALVVHEDFDQRPPKAPRPSRLTSAQLRDLATSLQRLLAL